MIVSDAVRWRETPEDIAIRKDLVQRAIGAMAPREREVIYKRFGLNGEEELTYKEIAKEMGRSAPIPRFLETKAIKRAQKAFMEAGLIPTRYMGISPYKELKEPDLAAKEKSRKRAEDQSRRKLQKQQQKQIQKQIEALQFEDTKVAKYLAQRKAGYHGRTPWPH